MIQRVAVIAAIVFGLAIEGFGQAPKTMSYQGLLTSSSGAPLQGTFSLSFRLFSVPAGGSALWTETHGSVSVQNGTFSVILGSITPLNALSFGQQLYLGVTEGANPEYTPRVTLAGVPYAFRADTATYLAGGGGAFLPLSGGTMTGPITSSGNPSITMGKGNFGDGNTNAGLHAFVAGSNNRANGSYSTVSGGGGISIADSNSAFDDYATVGGGRANKAIEYSSTVSGGSGNTASGEWAFIGGGGGNVAGGYIATVAGGSQNVANGGASVGGGFGNNATGLYSVVGGGGDLDQFGAKGNSATGAFSTVSGGNTNTAGADWATVGGGAFNTATEENSTVAGGRENSASGENSTVSGGKENIASGSESTVGGGISNDATAQGASIAGGMFNSATSTGSTVGGGLYNYAHGQYSVVGGGGGATASDSNSAVGDYATVGGGTGNTASYWATVSGGKGNSASSNNATVGGGQDNTAFTHGTVGGGVGNSASSSATVGGGEYNQAASSHATVAGGQENVASGSWSTIGGGNGNTITVGVGTGGTIGGGFDNRVTWIQGTVSGGFRNTTNGYRATIGGGGDNEADSSYSTVSGGANNYTAGDFATVPGGNLNTARGFYSFAAGRRAKAEHNGAFVWADQTDADFSSSAVNQFNVRASGGTRIYSNSGLTAGVTLAAGAGSWASVSDSTLKQNTRMVDGKEILEKLTRLPIKQWSYKSQDPSVEHIGPMAQDFHALFGLGENNTTISTTDPSGVALAAIQQLLVLVRELQDRNSTLHTQNADLTARIERMESVLNRLTGSGSDNQPMGQLIK